MLGPHRRGFPTPRTTTRRQLLGAIATGSAAALAGCALDAPQADADKGGIDDQPSGNESSDDETPGGETEKPLVPDSFDVDRDTLREYSREFVGLLADGEFEAAAQWFPPSTLVGPGGVENVWEQIGGTDSELTGIKTVAYLGNNLDNDVFTLRIGFSDHDSELTLAYNDTGLLQATGLEIDEWTPPEYVDPDAIVEQQLSLSTPIGCELGATITLPANGEAVPGVVLVHGNGPQDRDGTVGPNRPFKELAWGLASRGIAVLRYDKRTYACNVDHATVTIDDIVTVDALTAIQRLRENERVADDEIFVSGSSFGGRLTPRIAARDGNVAGTVMLAPGPAGSFADTILRQQRHQLQERGVSGIRREQILEQARAEAEQIRQLDIAEDEVVRFGGREYYRTLQEYDHLETAERLEVPQLLLQGGMDWQVTVEDDLPIWREALGDEPNVEITVYDDLNHLFQVSDGTLLPSEYARPETPVAKRVIEDIAAFVEEAAAGERTAAGRAVLTLG